MQETASAHSTGTIAERTNELTLSSLHSATNENHINRENQPSRISQKKKIFYSSVSVSFILSSEEETFGGTREAASTHDSWWFFILWAEISSAANCAIVSRRSNHSARATISQVAIAAIREINKSFLSKRNVGSLSTKFWICAKSEA